MFPNDMTFFPIPNGMYTMPFLKTFMVLNQIPSLDKGNHNIQQQYMSLSIQPTRYELKPESTC